MSRSTNSRKSVGDPPARRPGRGWRQGYPRLTSINRPVIATYTHAPSQNLPRIMAQVFLTLCSFLLSCISCSLRDTQGSGLERSPGWSHSNGRLGNLRIASHLGGDMLAAGDIRIRATQTARGEELDPAQWAGISPAQLVEIPTQPS